MQDRVLNVHRGKVQTWNGLTYQMTEVKEAKKLEKEGLVQITCNLQASELKSAAEFNKAREARDKTRAMKADAALPGLDGGSQTYKTREMRAED